MSEFKDKYYEHKKIADLNFEGHIDEVDNYIKELEEQNEKLQHLNTDMFLCLIDFVNCKDSRNLSIYEENARKIIERIKENKP